MKINKKRLAASLAAGALCLSCAGCGTSLGTNAKTYVNTTSVILKNLFSGSKPASSQSAASVKSGTPLEAPSGFSVDENGNYAFTGVENAEYYLLYFCAPDATSDDDTFIYSSDPIRANDTDQYTGHCSDAFSYAFGDYLVKVYAFPDLTDDRYEMSTAAMANYSYSGEQSAPQIAYYWDTFTGTMGVQISNMDEYLYEAYPEKVDVIFTNTADSSDTLTLTIENVSTSNYEVSTTALKRGASYEIKAVAENSSTFVLNTVSDTTVVSESLTLGESNEFVNSYTYSDGFANDVFCWPVVAENFDLASGGEGGYGRTFGRSLAIELTPQASEDDAVYSYSLKAGNWIAGGSVSLYADGTLRAVETGGGPVNYSSLNGTWVDNGDGTATLSYDHSTLVIE